MFKTSFVLLSLVLVVQCAHDRFAISGSPVKGPAGARAMFEFTDFDCAPCREVQETLRRTQAAHPLRIVFKSLPLADTDVGRLPHLVAFCVHAQNKDAFWLYYDLMFSNSAPARDKDFISTTARTLDLDESAMNKCANSEEASLALKRDRADAETAGVTGTPTFFLGDARLEGDKSTAEFLAFVKANR